MTDLVQEPDGEHPAANGNAPPAAPALTASGGRPPRAYRLLLLVLLLVSLALSLLLVVRAFVLTPFRIPTSSMEPTLLGESPDHGGDTIVVNRLAFLFSGPERWDVVALRPVETGEPGSAAGPSLVKRVVGLPGETLEISDGAVLIDGKPMDKPPFLENVHYIQRGNHGWRPLQLGPGEYFVLGDNSYLSQDSRQFGPVPEGHIFGRVEWILLPSVRRGRVR